MSTRPKFGLCLHTTRVSCHTVAFALAAHVRRHSSWYECPHSNAVSNSYATDKSGAVCCVRMLAQIPLLPMVAKAAVPTFVGGKSRLAAGPLSVATTFRRRLIEVSSRVQSEVPIYCGSSGDFISTWQIGHSAMSARRGGRIVSQRATKRIETLLRNG